MAGAYRLRIQHLERCIQLLEHVDSQVYAKGRDIFASDAALADWLASPEVALKRRVPLVVMRTKKGRTAVANVLTAIAHGVIL